MKSDGGSTLFRPSGQERDRPVFDPRDYKIETLPASLPLGAWKKWKHELGIYLATFGPSWRGVKLALQQGRHSAMQLVPTREGMVGVFNAAREANNSEDPFEPALFEYAAKASTLYSFWLQS